MANYYASARSNYFRVKDKEAFIADFPCDKSYINFEQREGKEYCCLLFEEDGIPAGFYNTETKEEIEIDWAGLFAWHLEEDSIAVFIESGAEKLRYVVGIALAYNSKGEELRLDLYDIYRLISKEWGEEIEVTLAEY